jgi:hypothetical protein
MVEMLDEDERPQKLKAAKIMGWGPLKSGKGGVIEGYTLHVGELRRWG